MSLNAADPWSEFAPADPTGPDMAATNVQTAPGPAAAPAPAAAPTADAPAPGSKGDQWSEFKPAPDSPAPITDSGTTMGFADQAPTEASKQLSLEDTATFYRMLRGDGMPKASADELRTFIGSKGLSLSNADEIVQDRDAGRGVVGSISYPLPKVETGDGATGAAARGAADGMTLGLAPRLFAVGDTVNDLAAGKGFDYTGNLDTERGRAATDEEDHFGAHIAGELLGGLVLPVGVEKAGLTATVESVGLAAGRDALREGLSMSDARAIASRAITKRLAGEGAAYGGAYGFNSSYGSPSQRLLSAGTGAAEGGIGGAVLGGIGEKVAPLLSDARAAGRALPAAEKSDAADVAQAAKDQNVAILPQDIGGPTIQRATQGAAQTTFGARTVSDAANRLYDSFDNRVGEVAGGKSGPVDAGTVVGDRAQQAADRASLAADRTSAGIRDALGSPVDETAAGQLIQRGVSRFMDETAQRIHSLYEAIPITADRPAQLGQTRQFLNNANAEWQSNPKLGALFQNGRLASYLDALTPNTTKADTGLLDAAGKPITRDVTDGGALNWQDLKDFRTHVGDMLANPRLDEKIAPRQLQGLYGSLSQDMEATAKDAGAYPQWRRANDYADGRMKRINDTFSMVLGARKDATPNEAYTAMQSMLRGGSTGNAAAFGRIMRSIPSDDANAVRSSIVSDARGGSQFDPNKLTKVWSGLSERGKSALLPQPGMRSLMDDAATRAAASDRNPLAGKSPEQIYSALETMAGNRGDSIRFRTTMAKLSPDEANTVRAAFINEGGKGAPGAQNGTGDAFSIARWLTKYNTISDTSKDTLFGSGDLRKNMDQLALLADRVKKSEKLAGHSNTGAVLGFNKTTGGLAAVVGAIVTGHPLIAAGLATPIAYQRISAEMLTSPRLLNWLARVPAKPNLAAQEAHLARLSSIAKAEPAIAGSVLALQRRIQDMMATTPLPLAAHPDDKRDSR